MLRVLRCRKFLVKGRVKWINLTLLLLLAALQVKLWFGDGSLQEMWAIRGALVQRQEENALLEVRNSALAAEVINLKTGLSAIEERARTDLGMVREGEVFFQVIDR